jgi:NAD(P)H dehydrogenase (quinone)
VNVLVVYAHPVEGSFASSVRDTALAALRGAGHDVRLIDLYASGFEPCVTATEHATMRDGLIGRRDITEHALALRWARAIVFVHPTWFGAQPAILKGWFDRVWIEGVAYTLPPGSNRIKPLLRNVRHLVVVTTHGSSKLVNSLQGEAGKRLVGRGLRVLCHRLARTRWIAMYGMDRATDDDRLEFLSRVERRLAKL